jgi:phosphoadenosine phosphosulfate reductase
LLPSDVEQWTAERVIGRLLEQFPGKVALACSFQKEETVLLDMLIGLEPKARVFAIDTHYLFPETYAYWREVEQRYNTSVEVFAGPSQEQLEGIHGERFWEHKPDLYLAVTKVAPLVTALGGLDAWITGIRRDQSPTRADAPKLGWDEQHELWKANPLADWTDEMCWDYIRARDLPYNPLHDRGYDSIGDTHSTQPGEGRSGRWAGTDKTECGIHTVAPEDVKELLGARRLDGAREAEAPALPALEQQT